MKREHKMEGLLLSAICMASLSSICVAVAKTDESLPGEFTGLRFPESGVVRRDMVFRSLPQPCLYAETPTKWSTDWRRMGREPFPYLYRVSPRKAGLPADIVFEDFESGTYENWTVEGTAFTRPTMPAKFDHPQPIRGHQGAALADSATGDPKTHQWDVPQGKLVSKPVRINRRYIRFLIGGGNHPGRTCVNLLVDGRVVRTATGRNSEELLPRTWDVTEFRGKQGVIEIVDAHGGGWGHILVDEIVLSDDSPEHRKKDPPLGMRSAVPLGGLGAGTIELRADGSLRDWNIFNNHPHNRTRFGGKVQLDDALFGLRIEAEGLPARAWALRTHAPGDLPCIEQIEYSGSFPVSRLRFSDGQLPIEVDLYACSEFHIGNAKASATPAAIFSFLLRNPSDRTIQTSLLFHLPNHIEGEFSDKQRLVLTRDGEDSISGSMAVQVAGSEETSCASGASLAEVWKPFAARGRLERMGKEQACGAIVGAVSLKPGHTRTMTFALGWFFPHKPFWRASAKRHEIVGNYYTHLFTSAEDVVGKVLKRLPATLTAARRWHQLCFENDLPAWLHDSMVNSPATMFRTGMWVRDGRWRQFESFSCPYLDPIHVQLYRSQTFACFFPELLESLLEGFVKTQRKDGYIAHDLGRNAGFDVSSYNRQTSGHFLINVYQHYRLTGDRELLKRVWPASRRAAEWAIRQCGPLKLPTRLQSTYEIKYDRQDGAAYNSFIYLTGLAAAGEMARLNGDGPFANRLQGLLEEARQIADERFWTGQFYRAWWNANGRHPDAIQSDTLYGQLWASLLGLGSLAPHQKIKSQLASEKRLTDTPFGLQVLVGREPGPYLWDETIWPAASMTWAALMIYHGGDVDQALAMAKKSYDMYATRLRDPWDIKDVYAKPAGYPWCNSHYGRQNILWSIPLALSGQQYDAAEKTLSFHPKAGAPAALPWFLPGANGIVRRLGKGAWQVTVLSGELELAELRIADAPPARDVSFEAGQSLTVHAR